METYWISKFALSAGVIRVQGTARPDFRNLIKPDGFQILFNLGNEIHSTEAEAIAKAEDMRTKKLQSLYINIQELKSKKFAGAV
jgi:hypothetical protein